MRVNGFVVDLALMMGKSMLTMMSRVINRFDGNVGSKFDDRRIQGHLSQPNTVIYSHTPQEITLHMTADLLFKVAHEQTVLTSVHFEAHSDATNLVKETLVKLKGGEGEYKFCEAYQSHSIDVKAGFILPRKN